MMYDFWIIEEKISSDQIFEEYLLIFSIETYRSILFRQNIISSEI